MKELLDSLRKARDARADELRNVAAGAGDSVGGAMLSDSDETSATRLEEGEPKVAVVLVLSYNAATGELETIHGDKLSAHTSKRAAAVALAKATVSVVQSQAPPTNVSDLKPLAGFVYLGGSKADPASQSPTRIGVVVYGRVLDIRLHRMVNDAEYSSDKGYTYTRRGIK